MKLSGLYSQYATALKLCEDNGIDKHYAVKSHGQFMLCTPAFNTHPNNYTFPIAIIEGKPVFKGDELWQRVLNGHDFILTQIRFPIEEQFIKNYSWEKPKPKTLNLNGQEIPAPIKQNNHIEYGFTVDGKPYYFTNEEDCMKTLIAIKDFLDGV